jgi:hypothetical protein
MMKRQVQKKFEKIKKSLANLKITITFAALLKKKSS